MNIFKSIRKLTAKYIAIYQWPSLKTSLAADLDRMFAMAIILQMCADRPINSFIQTMMPKKCYLCRELIRLTLRTKMHRDNNGQKKLHQWSFYKASATTMSKSVFQVPQALKLNHTVYEGNLKGLEKANVLVSNQPLSHIQ